MGARTVTVRELRGRGGAVIEQVTRDGSVIVTRDGDPVAELRPLPRPGLTAAQLVERRKHLPDVDPETLRRDVDDVLDMSL